MTLYDETHAFIADTLSHYARPVVWASGGKDSTALLHVMRPWTKMLTVIHTALDDGWPGITETLRDNCKAWGFEKIVIVKAGIGFEEYIEYFGWPVEIVPTRYEGATAIVDSCYRDNPIKFSAWTHCNYARVAFPLVNATATLNADLVIAGSRMQDAPTEIFKQVVDGQHASGWKRVNPLAEWTTDEIYAYIDKHHIALPPLYEWKRKHQDYEWVDCLSCSWQPQHFEILRQYYPEEYKKRWPRIKEVYDVYRAELQREQEALSCLSLATKPQQD